MNEHNVATDPMVWGQLGNCVGVNQDLFFPRRGDDPSPAKALCRACPVRTDCLSYALETNQKFGIWGGMTEGQRRRLKRAQPQPDREPVRHLRLLSLPPS